MKQRIQEWLDSSRHYLVGRALYNTFGKDQELKDLFARGQSAWNADKLAEALEELCQGTAAKVLNDEYAEMPAADDTILQSLHLQWKTIYASMNYKRHELDHYTGNDANSISIRRTLALSILDLEQQCMAVWAQRDYYMEHGKLPAPVPTGKERPTDPVALGRYIEATKKRLRRNKANLAKYPDKTLYAELLKRDEEELKDILNQ
jgi:hypothetical protein